MTRVRVMSPQTRQVLAALIDGPAHGYALMQTTGLSSGSLYPILARCSARGLVVGEWEAEQPVGRPRRLTFHLTESGAAAIRHALERTTA